jgi:hypothetical protein
MVSSQQNGRYERMHRTLQQDTAKPSKRTWTASSAGSMSSGTNTLRRPYEALDKKLQHSFISSILPGVAGSLALELKDGRAFARPFLYLPVEACVLCPYRAAVWEAHCFD